MRKILHYVLTALATAGLWATRRPTDIHTLHKLAKKAKKRRAS